MGIAPFHFHLSEWKKIINDDDADDGGDGGIVVEGEPGHFG